MYIYSYICCVCAVEYDVSHAIRRTNCSPDERRRNWTRGTWHTYYTVSVYRYLVRVPRTHSIVFVCTGYCQYN